jgi:diaminohydroxyphosphoribosylaminopyrimidine deaminase/5-amino-6-(5-phosphoribosylamino)uracil reductase
MVLPALSTNLLTQAMEHALVAARSFAGATAPNPCVGACVLDATGQIIDFAAHERAGTLHAEAKVIQQLRDKKLLHLAHTLVVTLEPCNHHGRTPPCTEAILSSGIKHVAFGSKDPNTKVAGSGSQYLSQAGVLVTPNILQDQCDELIRNYSYWCSQERPWLIVKQALNVGGTMIPPVGQKTFTSPDSILFAHQLRRQSDAIITGSGTILADNPLFTVRALQDFPHKQRWLLIFDRRNRVSLAWRDAAKSRGFKLLDVDHAALGSLEAALSFLGQQGCHQALLEAGPELTRSALESGLWNQHVIVQQSADGPDQITTRSNSHVYGYR